MRNNLEIKAPCPDLDRAEKFALSLNPEFLGEDRQEDHYFKTVRGRLKLRISSISGTYLIPYMRPDIKGKRLSRFMTIPIENADSLIELFNDILGEEKVVRKIRKIYLWENVRIHLDSVEGVGNFIEFEGMFDPGEEQEKEMGAKLTRLMKIFNIDEHDLISHSYFDMKKG